MIEAKYYKNRLKDQDFSGINLNSELELVECGAKIDLSKFKKLHQTLSSKSTGPESDFEFSQLIHKIIVDSGLAQNFYYDLRFWQWLSLELKDYVIWRWSIDEIEPKKSHVRRFIGGGGNTGFSLNSLSRLFIPAHVLLKDKSGKKLLQGFWDNQQIELSVSQCADTINDEIFIGATKATINCSTKDINKKIIKLNAIKSSMFLDNIPSEDFVKLLALN